MSIPPLVKKIDEDIKKEFIRLCKIHGTYNSKTHWVSLDKLWWKPDVRSQYCSIVKQYFEFLLPNYSEIKNLVLLSPETISHSFGLTPILSILANQLGLNLAIWQENGDFTNHSPILIGEKKEERKVIVIQDVVRHGTTILKISHTMKQAHWQLIGYSCLIQNSPEKSTLIATKNKFFELTNTELNFSSLIDISELK